VSKFGLAAAMDLHGRRPKHTVYAVKLQCPCRSPQPPRSRHNGHQPPTVQPLMPWSIDAITVMIMYGRPRFEVCPLHRLVAAVTGRQK
jgi:hypothetical protein